LAEKVRGDAAQVGKKEKVAKKKKKAPPQRGF
jgi:hypothetical protein